MVSINYSSREVCCKIVYYGPGLSGKTTNLLYVHSKVPSGTRGKMISLATEADRTLYFDFLPINIGTINGFAAKFQLYTVPGQVYYNATRKLVLRGVDGVVFVADSQPDKMDENIESLSNLEDNLQEYGYNLNDLPMVIQYNKRDLPGILSVDELNARLNTKGRPYFESSATLGNGVFDTLKLIIRLVLEKAKSNASSKPKPVNVDVPNPTGTSVADTTPQAASTPAVPKQTSTSQTTAAPAPSPSATPPDSGISTTTASVTAAGVAVVSDEKESTSENMGAPVPPGPEQYRPYPGSDSRVTNENKISPTSFTPTHKEEKDDNTICQKVIKANKDGLEDSRPGMITPIMAPSIRRRKEKKRGFFKRLFGIK